MDFNLSDNMQDVYRNRINFGCSTSVYRLCTGGLVSNNRLLVWFKDFMWISSALSKHGILSNHIHGKHARKGLNTRGNRELSPRPDASVHPTPKMRPLLVSCCGPENVVQNLLLAYHGGVGQAVEVWIGVVHMDTSPVVDHSMSVITYHTHTSLI